MKRIARIVCTLLALATVAACTLSFAACGKKADDLETVRKNGKLVVGITEFAPMDYRDADKNWIGFDADAASAVVDFLMAISMVGEGTDYSDLTYTVRLADEEYGVGFRKNSNLTEKLNEFLAAKTADGTLKKIAEKYGIQDYLIGN